MAKGEEKAKAAIAPMQIEEIYIPTIDVGPQMIRHDQDDDDVIELAGDIAAHGLLQPIGVSPLPNGRNQLRWGSRRLAAYVRLHRTTIPARICDNADNEDIISTALRENLLRRQLTLAEEIDAIHSLTAEGLAAAQISNLLGKSRSWVDRRLAFRSLPPELREHTLSGDLPLGSAEALALLTDPSARAYLLSWALANRPSLASLRAAIEAIAASPTFGDAVEAGTSAAQHPQQTQQFRIDCHVCRTPTTLEELVIVRTCRPCTAAMAGAGQAKEPDHADN
jgi:ParB/RepB/Spo0J family partition protein